MKQLFRIILGLLMCMVTWGDTFGQKSDTSYIDKNSLDLQLLGNKGFVAIGYNRIIFSSKRLYCMISPVIGFVPGSSEDTLRSIPAFAHINIGLNIVYGDFKYRVAFGVSYSKIFLRDTYRARSKSNYNRMLGEIAFIRYFPRDRLGLKFAYTPILYDDGANDVENVPVSFAFQIGL